LKVLMTADTVGGVWTYCMDLCRSLQLYNVEVHLVTMGAKMESWQQQEVNALENVVVYETDFVLEWMQNPWMDIEECGEWLLMLENDISPDLVHLNCFAYGCLPFKAPVLVVAHSDVFSWYLSVKRDDPPAEWNRYFWCVKNGLSKADTVVAPSEAKLQLVSSIYNFSSYQQVIYNGRSGHLFSPGEKQPLVFSMGRIWDEAKNIRLLAEAAPYIKAPVRIAGETSFDTSCFQASAANLNFLGKISTGQVAAELASASVYVLPARYEPFGLSALEAALSGCALVLGDIPTLREIWGDAAVYVDVHNRMELAEAVNSLIEDPERLALMSSKAREKAKQYSAAAMARQYMQLYRQLVPLKTQTVKKEIA